MVHIKMELRVSEGRVYGSRYYTVEPEICWDPTNDWGSILAWMDLEKWCTATFGEVGSIWETGETKNPPVAQRWYMNGAKFWFREKKDLEWFILKWQ